MMRYFVWRWTTCLAMAAMVLQLSGCATATGPKFSGIEQPAADQGDVYLYRGSAFAAIAQSFDVLVNGKKTASLPNASFVRLRLKPGDHVLLVTPGGLAKKSSLHVKVEAGTTRFYEYDFLTGLLANAFFIGSNIVPREPAKALEDLKELKAASAL